MKILVAPNALKGSLSPHDAAAAISQALNNADSRIESILCPIADGGDGTLECLVRATGGTIFAARVQGPLPPSMVDARWGDLGDGTTAVIEMAEAAGLHLLKPGEYDVANASTAGVGELIRKALQGGYKKIVVGLGGSATNDGGAGCARALGVRFLDAENRELPDGGIHLTGLHSIQLKNAEPALGSVEFIGLADVSNVLHGPFGTAHTYARQKGATDEQIDLLDAAMKKYASIIERDTGRDVSRIPGAGAAGGLAAGLAAFCNARIVFGIDYVLDTIRFEELLQQSDCVITAEGMLDDQTLRGKGIDGVARRARKYGKPVYAFVGRVRGNPEMLLKKLGLTSLRQISPDGMPIDGAMREAGTLLGRAVQDFFSTKGSSVDTLA